MNPYAKPKEKKVGANRPKISHLPAELETRIRQQRQAEKQAVAAEDQARFFHAAHQFLKALETIHYHYVYGLLDTQLWEGWRDLLQHYVSTPGLSHYLSRRGSVFSERFCKFISELEPVSERRTVGNLLGVETRPSA